MGLLKQTNQQTTSCCDAHRDSAFFLAGFCILVGVSVYTHHYANTNKNFTTDNHHGYCFILTWICFCFTFIIGILYMVLRKK